MMTHTMEKNARSELYPDIIHDRPISSSVAKNIGLLKLTYSYSNAEFKNMREAQLHQLALADPGHGTGQSGHGPNLIFP